MRVLSGIQPTGPFHWGNYFGAIRQYIELQDQAREAYYFIANLHALTTVRDRDLLRKYTLDGAIDLLALGLNPERAILFVQSDVPEVSELSWLLMTGTPMGLLERAVSYKDKIGKGLKADVGLFTYPVLQAADILAYDADVVPVGEDQIQHIEICRDIHAQGLGAGQLGPRARRRRREDVQELRQHAGRVRRREGPAEADHADHD
jgi:tryptophanyl-tRNA synthetase